MQKIFNASEGYISRDAMSRCIRCKTKIKKEFYFQGHGPYGVCCYKKLFGDIHRLRITARHKIPVVKLCVIGLPKNCNNCILSSACEYSEATNGRK